MTAAEPLREGQSTGCAGDPSDADQLRLVTIIIPAMNEEESIGRVESELLAVVDPLPYRFEFLVVDNGSTDRTPELVKDLCARDPRWKYVRFSRNFTLEMSITAGYHHASGDAIIVLYSDLQDPPSVIPRFLETWEQGYDVVFGVRTQRPGDARWRNALVGLAYRLIAWCADHTIPRNTGDFRLVDRRVRDALEHFPETNRYTRGLIAWLGFRQVGVEYERVPRQAGKSKFPFFRTLFYTFDAITSFSLRPLRLFLLLGIAMTFISMVALVVYPALYLLGVGSAPRGITTLIVLAFFTAGINSLGIGVLGEYLGRTYLEVKRRPLYLIQESVGLTTVRDAGGRLSAVGPPEHDRARRPA